METVQVMVPVGKAAVVERCATILTAGGAEAEALEECANPISAMTLGEAKTIADLLRQKENPTMYQNQATQQPYIGDQRGVLTVALNAVRRAGLAVVRWHQRRRAIRELMALDDRTLRDINVRRDDIYWVTGRIFSLGEDPFHFSPASPPTGRHAPRSMDRGGTRKFEKARRQGI